MGWGTFIKNAGKAVMNIGKFAYEHPEAIEVVAAATGHAGVATGLATIVAAKKATTPQPVPVDVIPLPSGMQPPKIEVTEINTPAIVPEVDLVGKWRGTLDRMAMDVLGYRMAEDELFNNAKLLERGDVAGVVQNLNDKKPKP